MARSLGKEVPEELVEIINKPYDQRTMLDIEKILQAATPPSRIEWRPQGLYENHSGGYSALALAYTDARFVQDRFDDACGPFNWQSAFEVAGQMLMVGLGIRNPDTKEWVWKWDTGESDDSGGYGGGKGLFSGGIKRSAFQWGVARDLYSLPKPRVACKAYKKKGRRGDEIKFQGWIDNPWEVAESPETGRLHRSQVERSSNKEDGVGSKQEPTVEYIPASSTTFFNIAYQKLQWDRENARDALQPYIDKQTGDIDYEKAILVVEKNLPPDDRDFTIQQEEIAKREAEESGDDTSD